MIVVAHQQLDEVLLQTVQHVRALLQLGARGQILVLRAANANGPDVRIGQHVGQRRLVGRFDVQKYGQIVFLEENHVEQKPAGFLVPAQTGEDYDDGALLLVVQIDGSLCAHRHKASCF